MLLQMWDLQLMRTRIDTKVDVWVSYRAWIATTHHIIRTQHSAPQQITAGVFLPWTGLGAAAVTNIIVVAHSHCVDGYIWWESLATPTATPQVSSLHVKPYLPGRGVLLCRR